MKKNTFLVVLFFCMFQLGFSQNLSQYTFSQSNTGFTAISGGTALGSTTTDDQRFLDPATPLGSAFFTGVGLPIGFNFTYNGYVYDRFAVNANGWISLGSSLLTPSVDMNTTTSYSPLSSTSTAVSNTLVARISAFSRDLMSQAGGEIRYELTGTAPNRVLVVQWKNYAKYLAAGDSFTFQIRLNETSNIVQLAYGSMANNVTSTTADCGLRANPSATASNFSSRTTATNWSATTASVTANDTVLLSSTIFPASGLTYSWTPPPSCTGAPTPGNTISSTALACSGVGFTLSLQNSTAGSGIIYQWQTSATGSGYTNASGASTDSNYSATQSATTYYQCVVTCTATGLSTISTPVMVGMNSPLNCYCTPTYTTGKTDGDLISNISIAGTTLANNSGTSPVNPAYTFFTGQPNYTGTLQAGSTYNVSVSVGTFGSQNVAVWIDYNDDGLFSTPERVGYTTASIDANGTASFPITLACNPALGTHRMRVRDVWNTSGITIDPCANYGWGETEDYNITISAPVACPQPSALAASSITATTATLTWNLGCSETMWDVNLAVSGSGTPTGTPTNSNVSSPFTANGLTPSTSYEFYVRANCQSNGTSLWTGPFNFVTAPANDDCAGAVALTIGNVYGDNPVTGSNVSASNSNPPAPGCASFLGGDVWYKVIVPISGSVTVETGSVALSPISDTGIAVYIGTCNSLTLVQCDDDSSTNGNFSLISLTGRTPGEVLYINAWEYGNDAYGQFQISAYDCPSTVPAPTGSDTQIFCSAATVGDLYVDGNSIQWYATATGGTVLSTTDSLVDGNTYYASQTIDCEGYNRFEVTAVVSSFPVTNTSSLSSCSDVFDLTSANSSISSETNVVFTYFIDSFDADNDMNPIVNPAAFTGTDGQIIYVKVKNNYGCYSIAELTLAITTTLVPTGNDGQTFCGTSTLADLVVNGTSILWYDAATAGNLLPSTTALVSGTIYYASQTVNSCESNSRLGITVTESCPFAGCLTAPNGQYPFTTFTPACIGTTQDITPFGYAGEYSKVNVTSGVDYTFSSSIATDVITIGDENGTIAYTYGTGSVVWTSTLTGIIRFYTHADTNCTDNQDTRSRSVFCGTPPPPPANDDCSGSVALTAGGVFNDYPQVGTNFGATSSTGVADPICSSYLGGDVWFSVVVPASGSITFETNSDGTSAVTDTGIEAFSGTCGALTSLDCDDDSGTNFFSLLSLTSLTPGSTIYLRVFDYDNAEFGTFQVSAYDPSLGTNSFNSTTFNYYPNPVKDVLNLNYSETISKVQVINLLGQEVSIKNINATQGQVDMSQLPSGTYLVKVTAENNEVKTIKVIKQ
ncbi:GEVED domain-containing protein [Flavobacterium sp. SUN052]|uniref:GEVED domain-containing protein n=1 Tax=Flavobacterium sp. SUN052 TaxID=3002441 RepID=UPI00237D58F5|nr:GEVED domain-containing protein [Flavobacterium sp. SUN052]MEC4003791.1 GEVED domain-containing protein [Flavobacterium sp. SUN052]